MFTRIDHVGVAVAELEPALELYRDRFQLLAAHREVVEAQGVEAVLLDTGENHIELLLPLGADTPVGRFLERNGPGLHHLAYQVDDIERTLGALKDAGLELIDEQLGSLYHALGEGGWHEIESEEGPIRVDASQVCYVRAESHDQRVGFGA